MHLRVLLWILCSFKMGAMFLFKGQTKKLVLVWPSFSTPVLFLKLAGTKTSLVHWD